MSWIDASALRVDEKVIDSWEGIREVVGSEFEVKLNNGKEERKKITVRKRKEGLLVLTNQRLLFLEGLEPNGKKLGESVKVSLIDVDKVWREKAPVKQAEEPVGYETHYFLLKKVRSKGEFNNFKKLVEEHCQKRREEFEKETKKIARLKID